MFYLSVFIGLIFLRFSRTRRGQFYLPVLVALFLLSAFRFEVGCDWPGYLYQFRRFSFSELKDVLSNREPLWLTIFFYMHQFDIPYPWINVISSLIFFFGVDMLARRQPDPLAFLVLLFPILIINMPMSGIRQGAAIGIMCMAFAAFNNRSLVTFVLLTFLASTLHSSAIIFLLLAPLVTGGYSWKRLVGAALIALPGGFLLLSSGDAEVASSRYIGTGLDAAGAVFRVGLLVITAGFFFLFVRRRWAFAFPHDYKLVSIGSMMMAATIFLVPISSVIGDRIGYYLIPIQTMIFARLPFLPIQQNRQLYINFPYIILVIVFATWTFMSTIFQQCYIPYHTWLFGFPESTKLNY